MKPRVTGRAGAILATLVGLAAAGSALGRAGGGGHAGSVASSTGGHGGGVSFGGGGGGIIGLLIVGFIFWLIFRRISRGSPGVQNLAASPMARQAIGAVLGAATGRGIGNLLDAPRGPPDRPGLPAAVDAIRAQDPGFEIETFLQRAEMTFFLVKRGLQKTDAAAIRPYLNDAVFAAVSANIGQMTAQHQHTLMEGLNVRGMHLVDAACGEQGQSLQVHFDLVYRGKTLDASNRVVSDEGEDRRHGERWTFVRAAAARTPTNGGAIASRCPACGAELRLSLDGTCSHCRASVTNGTVDWVVADVQSAPFVGYASDPLLGIAAPTVADGLASLRAADSAFDVNAFLTRVKTGFLALQDAWCRQNLEAGRAFLSPGAYFAWRAQLETMAAEGRRNVMEGLLVQEITPFRVVHGRVFDDLTVRIAAVSADYEVDASGRIVFGDRTLRPFVEEWTFQRSVGVATSGKAGLLENACPNCGAPLALTQIGECRYCKAAVTSGKFDWVVSRIEQEDGMGSADNNVAADLKTQLALQVGGAVIGGLLSSLLSDRNR
ncbi:MAG TPA: TIM44-like domain-containing protein [Steroidobacteraceae bacterium]|nr:TIM44-like domain-containing protein [Steroidobacteraceae bacterium]